MEKRPEMQEFVFVLKAILSCRTEKQLEAAYRLIDLYGNRNATYVTKYSMLILIANHVAKKMRYEP